MLECAICQHQNRSGAFFCAQCGAKLHFMEMPPAFLVEIRNPDEGPEYPVSSRVTYIGGSSCNQIVLSDESVSRHHAKITFAEGAYYLEDLATDTGTFVNGKRSKGRFEIGHGDTIRLGKITLRFQLARHAE